MRADAAGNRLFLLFLAGSGSRPGRLRLHHALELIHAAGGIDEFLLTGVKRVAGIADTHNDHWLRTGWRSRAAGATDFRLHIFRMNVCFLQSAGKDTTQQVGR